MEYSDLKNKDIKELQQTAKDLRVKLGKLRFELANKTLKDFSQVRQTKKDIARVMTALRKLT
jgi:large subunit ribosomal protein L29